MLCYMEKEKIIFFGVTTFRNQRKKFGIKTDDRRRHFYVVGKTGMGKTVLLENMAAQDIQGGEGIGFVDPHGEAAEGLLDFIPSDRIKDVVYFNPADIDYPIAFNIMENVDVEHRHLVAGGLMGVFKKVWPDVWSARMEYILNNCVLALLEYPGATLLGVNRMLSDTEYRKKVVDRVTDPVVKSFWIQEFARYTQRYEVEATAAIQNKIGQFISSPVIRNIVGQEKSSLNIRKIMDGGKILIANLSKGRIGEDNSRLLGALLITKLQLAAMSRVDIPEQDRKDFFLYVDEFQNFATESFVNILSEARKYRLSLILGHQYITQMEETVRDAVFGNVGTLVTFRVGAEDAEFLEKEFTPEFLATDLVNLGKYNICLKLIIDGVAGHPFSAETLTPIPKIEATNREQIITTCRAKYGVSREIVNEKITNWLQLDQLSAPASLAPTALNDAKCWICGKDTKVVFIPDGVRPVYCKSCRKKAEKEKEMSSTGVFTKKTDHQLSAGKADDQSSGEKTDHQSSAEQGLSLKKAMESKPIFFKPRRNEEENKLKRTGVNREELRQCLKESFDENKNKEDAAQETKTNVKKGVIHSGETVKL